MLSLHKSGSYFRIRKSNRWTEEQQNLNGGEEEEKNKKPARSEEGKETIVLLAYLPGR